MTRKELNFIASNSQYQKVLDKMKYRASNGALSVTLPITEEIRIKLIELGYDVTREKNPLFEPFDEETEWWYLVSWE